MLISSLLRNKVQSINQSISPLSLSTAFLLCIHLIYSLSFQSIFNDFVVPVRLLLLIVVVLYFICLYIVYPV